MSGSLAWFNLKSFGSYLVGNLIFQLTTIICEFVLLKMISQTEVGIIQLALLFQSYAVISRLGILNAFNLEYPRLISSGDVDKAREVLNTANTHIYISILLQALGFVVAAVYFYSTFQYQVATIMSCMILFTAIEALANFGEARARSELNFNTISKARSIAAIVVLTSLIFPLYLGLNGAVVRLVVIQASLLLLYYFQNKGYLSPSKLNFNSWKELFSIGWKLWLWSYLKSFGKSLPKLFVAFFMGLISLGLFAPIQWVLSAFILFTSSLSSYLYPKLTHIVASKSPSEVNRLALRIVLLTMLFLVPFVFAGQFFLPVVFSTWFPEYESVVPVLELVIWASFFEVISTSVSSWVSRKKWRYMYIYVVGALVIRISTLLIPYLTSNFDLYHVGLAIVSSSILIGLLVVIMFFIENFNWDKGKSAALE